MREQQIITYFQLNQEEMAAEVKPPMPEPEPPMPEPDPPKPDPPTPKPDPPKPPEPQKQTGNAGCLGLLILCIGAFFIFTAFIVISNSKAIPWGTAGALFAAAAVCILVFVFLSRKNRRPK